jgi:5'-nucleotidase (lipoprotein e(P4) family)
MTVTRFIALCLIISLFSACKQKQTKEQVKTHTYTKTLTDTLSRDISNPNEHMVMAVVYQQTAAEYRALCYQAYNLAHFMLDRDLDNKKVNLPRCVVLDIDETVLDNSPYEAKCILEKLVYPNKWADWISKASAKPVPGALDFLKYARSNGVEVYFVTNRKENERASTVDNLKSAGFNAVDADHLLMRGETSSKEIRRATIKATRHISLLFGDNLADFSDAFDGKLSVQDRFNDVEKLKKEFGTRFIILPNAMYGDWEGAVYDNDYSLSDSTKKIKRYNSLTGF